MVIRFEMLQDKMADLSRKSSITLNSTYSNMSGEGNEHDNNRVKGECSVPSGGSDISNNSNSNSNSKNNNCGDDNHTRGSNSTVNVEGGTSDSPKYAPRISLDEGRRKDLFGSFKSGRLMKKYGDYALFGYGKEKEKNQNSREIRDDGGNCSVSSSGRNSISGSIVKAGGTSSVVTGRGLSESAKLKGYRISSVSFGDSNDDASIRLGNSSGGSNGSSNSNSNSNNGGGNSNSQKGVSKGIWRTKKQQEVGANKLESPIEGIKQAFLSKLVLGEHEYKGQKYTNSFSGKHAVDVIMEQFKFPGRIMGQQVVKKLDEAGIYKRVLLKSDSNNKINNNISNSSGSGSGKTEMETGIIDNEQEIYVLTDSGLAGVADTKREKERGKGKATSKWAVGERHSKNGGMSMSESESPDASMYGKGGKRGTKKHSNSVGEGRSPAGSAIRMFLGSGNRGDDGTKSSSASVKSAGFMGGSGIGINSIAGNTEDLGFGGIRREYESDTPSPSREHVLGISKVGRVIGGQARLWIYTLTEQQRQKCPKEYIGWQESIFEIINTELDYIRDVKLIEDIYEKRMYKPENVEIVGRDRIRRFIYELFFNYRQVLEVSEQLADKLVKRQQEAYVRVNTRMEKEMSTGKRQMLLDIGDLDIGLQEETQKSKGADLPLVKNIGDIFLEWSEKLQPFIDYSINVQRAQVILEMELINNKKFVQLINEAENDELSRKLPIQSFLGRITARFARYPLLLEAIIKRVPETLAFEDKNNYKEIDEMEDEKERENEKEIFEDEKAKLVTAKERVKEALGKINELNGLQADSLRMMRLKSQIRMTNEEAESLDIDNRSRRILKEETMYRADGVSNMQVFLFDNGLIFTNKKRVTNVRGVYEYHVQKGPINLLYLLVSGNKSSATNSNENINNNTPTTTTSNNAIFGNDNGYSESVSMFNSDNNTNSNDKDLDVSGDYPITFTDISTNWTITLYIKGKLKLRDEWIDAINKQVSALSYSLPINYKLQIALGISPESTTTTTTTSLSTSLSTTLSTTPTTPTTFASSIFSSATGTTVNSNLGNKLMSGSGVGGGMIPTCMATYYMDKTKIILLGTKEHGVYMGQQNKPTTFKKVYSFNNTSNIKVLESYNMVFVLFEGGNLVICPLNELESYYIQQTSSFSLSLSKSSSNNNNNNNNNNNSPMTMRGTKLASSISYFAIGSYSSSNPVPLIVLVKYKSQHSYYKCLLPVDLSVERHYNYRNSPNFVYQNYPFALNVLYDFCIPGRSSNIYFFSKKLCIANASSFDVVDLNNRVITMSLPNLSSSTQSSSNSNSNSNSNINNNITSPLSHGKIHNPGNIDTGYGGIVTNRNGHRWVLDLSRDLPLKTPIAIFKVKKVFLLCYDSIAFYIDRMGNLLNKSTVHKNTMYPLQSSKQNGYGNISGNSSSGGKSSKNGEKGKNKEGEREDSSYHHSYYPILRFTNSPTSFAFVYPFIVSFGPKYLEIFNVNSGKLIQVIKIPGIVDLSANSSSCNSIISSSTNPHAFTDRVNNDYFASSPGGGENGAGNRNRSGTGAGNSNGTANNDQTLYIGVPVQHLGTLLCGSRGLVQLSPGSQAHLQHPCQYQYQSQPQPQSPYQLPYQYQQQLQYQYPYQYQHQQQHLLHENRQVRNSDIDQQFQQILQLQQTQSSYCILEFILP